MSPCFTSPNHWVLMVFFIWLLFLVMSNIPKSWDIYQSLLKIKIGKQFANNFPMDYGTFTKQSLLIQWDSWHIFWNLVNGSFHPLRLPKFHKVPSSWWEARLDQMRRGRSNVCSGRVQGQNDSQENQELSQLSRKHWDLRGFKQEKMVIQWLN